MRDDIGTATTLLGLSIAGRAGRWDMDIAGGRIARLRRSQTDGGGVVIPLTVDVHTHLDKTFTASRMPTRATSLFHAIDIMEADAVAWDAADIRRRAQDALSRAHQHGTAAMRSHVDWYTTTPPLAWSILKELARDWQGQVDLQLASLTPLDLVSEIGVAVAREVRATSGTLGAFVYRNDGLAEKIAHVFDLADRHDLCLDFHVDEGLDPEAAGIDTIVAETARRGMVGRVLCGHACSLSVRDSDEVRRTLDAMAAARVGLVVLPAANSYLQDASPGRTPRLRGLAPLQEARAAGVDVMIASDNVRDGFYPYGDYDLIDIFRLAVVAGHLGPDDWLDATTDIPARWIGRARDLAEGASADFIRCDASDLSDVICRTRTRREVWRGGAILPDPPGVHP